MQPYKQEKPRGKTPSGKWRELYPCRKLKGEHQFELVKPKYLDWVENIRKMSVREYYEFEEMRRGEEIIKNQSTIRKWFGVLYHWRCRACGKEELESTNRLNKRIKQRVALP